MSSISRRELTLKTVAGIAAASATGSSTRAALAATAASDSAPGNTPNMRPTKNVLLFVADDQTYRSINALNNPEVETPNLDKLVKRGTTFTHAHHQGAWHGAVCVASRAMLNTGRMLYHCGSDSCGDYPLMGQTFRGQGYDTFMTGKWHNSGNSLERSFEHVGPTGPGMYHESPFDFNTLEPLGDLSKSAYLRPAPGNTWAPDDTSLGGHWMDSDKNPGNTIHSSTRWADSTIGYLQSRAGKKDKPFFAYCAFHAPHDPRQAPTEYLNKYPSGLVKLPENYMPEHPFDQGDYHLRDEQLAPWPRSKECVQVHRQEYHAILTHMDMELGRILDVLEETGQTENTVIAFTADHGLAVGEHGLMGKQNLYDHSIRMPLIFAGPGVPEDQQHDGLVYQHSVFATLSDLTSVQAPDTVQFPSLMPQINGDNPSGPHDTVFSSYRHFQRMCRDDTHKLILYPHLGKWQLFNTHEDPWEINDLAQEPNAKVKYRPIIDKLWHALQQWQKDVNDQLVLIVADYGLG